MADQNIKINIGTSYDNSGMSRALRSVGGFSKEIGQVTGSIGRATAAIGQLGDSFDGLGGKASQTIGQLTSALGAIATGGTIGIITGGIAGWVSIFNSLKGATSKAKTESDNLKSSIEELAKSYNSVKDNATQVITANNQLAASITNVATALSNLKTAQGSATTIALGAKNARAVANAPDDEKGIVAAQGAVDMAEEKGKQAIEKSGIALQAASEKVGIYKKNLDEANRQLNQFTNTEMQLKSILSEAEDQFKEAVNNGIKGKELLKYNNALNSAQDALDSFMETTKDGEEARKAVRNAEQELLKANLELTTAQQNDANVRAQATADMEAAEQRLADEEDKAREDGVKSTLESISVQKERNDKMCDEAQAEKKLKETILLHEQHEKDLEQATKELEDAQLEYVYRLRRAKIAEFNTDWRTAGGGPDGAWNGGSALPADQIIGNGINGKDRYDPRNNASIHDAGYNERVQEGHARNAQSQGYGLSARDRDFQNWAAGKLASGQELSGPDMERFQDINSRDPEIQRQKAEQEAEKARQEAEAKALEKETKEQKLRDDVAEIVTLMNKLGLK